MASVDTQAQADYAVLTPERITLQYDVAGIGSRSAAALIDTAIQVAVLALLTVLVALVARLVGTSARSLDFSEASTLGVTVMIALFVVCVFAVLFGYYILFEIIWNGQTPGKRMLGLRVLRENGYPLRAGDATVRNLVRIIDAPPFGAVVGLTVMLFNKQSRRLGDFAAGSIVVREGVRRGVAALTGPPGHSPADGAADAGPLLSPADASLVRDFLVRRDRLDPGSRQRLAERLADALAARYGLQARRAGSSTEVFLERLAER